MKAILLLLLVVPFFILPPAYAEEITIDVPFKVAVQENQQACTLFFDPQRADIQVMRCWFTNQVMDEDYQPIELVPYSAPEPVPEPKVIPEEPKVELTQAQEELLIVSNTIEFLKEKNHPSTTEQWFIEQFEDRLTFCSYGILAAEAFQKQTQTVISPDWVQLVNGVPVYIFPELDISRTVNVRDGGPAADLYLENQACKGQNNYYDGDVSPQHYKNFLMKELPEDVVCTYETIQNEKYDCQPYHGTIATADAQPKEALSPTGDQKTEELRVYNKWICENPNFNTAFKKQNDCPAPEYKGTPFRTNNSEPVDQGPRNAVDAKVRWQQLSCGIAMEPVVNDRYVKYLEELEQRYACGVEQRYIGIKAFDSRTSTPEIIEQWIAQYEANKLESTQ